MDKESNAPSEKLQDSIDTAVKKVIVPVALTVGLLGNSAAADMTPDVRNSQAGNSEYLASENFDVGASPVTFDDAGEEDEDEDEEKRAYKGKNLGIASAASLMLTSTGAAESAPGEFAGEAVWSVFAFWGEFIGIFLILSVLFMGFFKALYPARKLKEIITGKNVLRILTASAVVFGVVYVADELTGQKNIFIELLKNGVILSVMLILWYKIFELKGRFGQVMKDLFWGKKGRTVLWGLAGFNMTMSILHIIYNSFYTSNTFTGLLVFYIISAVSVFGIYEMCKGRMVEDDELPAQGIQ